MKNYFTGLISASTFCSFNSTERDKKHMWKEIIILGSLHFKKTGVILIYIGPPVNLYSQLSIVPVDNIHSDFSSSRTNLFIQVVH